MRSATAEISRPSARSFPRRRSRLGLQLGPAAFLVGVPLLREGLSMDVIAAHLPEPAPVLRAELETSEPLGALPGVAFGNDQTERPAVLGRDVLAVVAPSDEDVVPAHRFEG